MFRSLDKVLVKIDDTIVISEKMCLETLYFFDCGIGEVHFKELQKTNCHVSAEKKREHGRKKSVFWSEKNRIWSGKGQ